MRRTKPVASKRMMINYYDNNKAQRWGRLVEEHENHVIVKDVLEERSTVLRGKIIKEQEVPAVPK